jgi:DNA-binding transcriptional ArsR family regulator
MAKTKSKRTRKHAAGVNAEVFKALSHPLRCRILVLLTERVASPRELADLLEETLDNVSYHCRKMAEAEVGLIELVATDQRHGGTQHYYKATARPILDTEEWEKVPRMVREVGTVSVAQLVVGDLSEAIRGGTFDTSPARSLLRMPMVVDEDGLKETGDAAMRLVDEFAEIQARSAARLAEEGEEGMNIATAILAFPVPSRSSE